MNKVNWRVRIKNLNFWITIVPMLILLIEYIGELFGLKIPLEGLSDKILNVIRMVFFILGLIGIVNDPTTEGFTDSRLAMLYDEPKSKSK